MLNEPVCCSSTTKNDKENMYKQLYAISLLSLASISVHSAEQLRKKTDEPSILKALASQPIIQKTGIKPEFAQFLTEADRQDKADDAQQAHAAARLIFMKANVCSKNSEGVTPLDIALKNQERFPKLYEVLMAGKTISTFNPPMDPPSNGSDYTPAELLEATSNIEVLRYIDRYDEAAETLEAYAQSIEPAEQKN